MHILFIQLRNKVKRLRYTRKIPASHKLGYKERRKCLKFDALEFRRDILIRVHTVYRIIEVHFDDLF